MMGDESDSERPEEELTWEEMRPWIEFGAWTMLVLAPILYWFNGPSVSDDQAVVRTGLVIISAFVAVGLRVSAWLRKRKR